jgi:hypothetical protein
MKLSSKERRVTESLGQPEGRIVFCGKYEVTNEKGGRSLWVVTSVGQIFEKSRYSSLISTQISK